jgi:hypothetical protein
MGGGHNNSYGNIKVIALGKRKTGKWPNFLLILTF